MREETVVRTTGWGCHGDPGEDFALSCQQWKPLEGLQSLKVL